MIDIIFRPLLLCQLALSKPCMKNITYVLLTLLLALQALSGLWGGSFLLADPSGGLFKMPVEMMKQGPFTNFFIPGLALFVLLGVVPAITLYGLIKRPHWKWAQHLNIYHNRHWSWAFSLYTGFMLIIWIDVQVAIIGFGSVLQAIYGITGLAITMLTLTPTVMNRYEINSL
jgi:hypothetical protein